MSILDKIKKAGGGAPARPYVLILGASGSGKTTIAGTIPGKTLLLSVKDKEFGSETAIAKADESGNHVTAFAVNSLAEIIEIGTELRTDDEFDNVFVDGFSALTYLAAEDPDIAALIESKRGGNPFAGYDRIRGELARVQKVFASLTYDGVKKPKRVFFTLATETKRDINGFPVELMVSMKGKASLAEFTRPAPTIVALASKVTEEVTERIMITKKVGIYESCRVNGLLDGNNPGVIEPDLGVLLNMMK